MKQKKQGRPIRKQAVRRKHRRNGEQDHLLLYSSKATERLPDDKTAQALRQTAVLQIQQYRGNAYVQRLVKQRDRQSFTARPSLLFGMTSVTSNKGQQIIQRKKGESKPEATATDARATDAATASEEEASFDTLIEAANIAIEELKTAEQQVADAKSGTNAEKKKAAQNFATAKTRHQEVILRLTTWTRGHLPSKFLLDSYLDRPDITREEKVSTLGQLAAAVARMEFLLGRMYHTGSGKWEKGSNKGEFPEHYQEAVGAGSGPWCTMFSGYAYSRLGFQAGQESEDKSMFRSGYRLRKWSKTGQNIRDKQVTPEEKAVAHEDSSGAIIDKAGWKQLTKDLKGEKTIDERKVVTQAFFEDKPLPQPGDIVVKTRGSGWGSNEFSSGQSHTMLVDHFDAENHVIWTVEGNKDDAVSARKIDLTNAKDVSQIIFISRLGTEYFGRDGETETEAADVAETQEEGADEGLLDSLIMAAVTALRRLFYSEEVLLGGMNYVNSRLVEINHAQGWIKSSDVDATVYEWITGSTETEESKESSREE